MELEFVGIEAKEHCVCVCVRVRARGRRAILKKDSLISVSMGGYSLHVLHVMLHSPNMFYQGTVCVISCIACQEDGNTGRF
jgi:hypothetical protein